MHSANKDVSQTESRLIIIDRTPLSALVFTQPVIKLLRATLVLSPTIYRPSISKFSVDLITKGLDNGED